ncbi:uncharacterized protein LOC120354472 [Nilaparvata lugens]|uniref:uncharacterized protein LOC120354472 n=1 Tax=Nilaparvata lugens TaxID=108931 RepID=UPI00193CCCCD|nr:uncharacterized protein LOC120354472 [Nilaparvata lugens]
MDIQQLKFLSSRGRKIQQLLKTNTPPESESASKIPNETIDNNSGQDFSQEAPPVIQNEIPVITPVPESQDEMINPFVANDSQSVHDVNISSSPLQLNEMYIEYYVVAEEYGDIDSEAQSLTYTVLTTNSNLQPAHDGSIHSVPQTNEMDISVGMYEKGNFSPNKLTI